MSDKKDKLWFRVFGKLNRMNLLHWIPDRLFLKIYYYGIFGKKLNLNNPQTFNEKLQWLKLYDRRPEYTAMVDKILAKEYVAKIIGERYIIPTLGVWDVPEQINFDMLPSRFVLKCNHNSGTGMYICKDKSLMNVEKVKTELRKGLKEDYYSYNREWPYKNVQRKILAEQYMEDTSTGELRDYKFFCFNGRAQFFKVDYDRFLNHRANYFDRQGKLLRFGETVCPPNFEKNFLIPSKLDKMLELSEKLSSGTKFLRVDFYQVNEQIYFGELTFFPDSGFGIFNPEDYDVKIGKLIEL